MRQYLNLIQTILNSGATKEDRTGTGTRSIFGYQMRFDLRDGFPLLTTKKLYTRAIIHELLWFLSGDTNIKYLKDNGVHIWDEWADEKGDLGPVYGHQWRKWLGEPQLLPTDNPGVKHGVMLFRPCIDQISNVIHDLKTNPDSRRLIVSAWNPADIPNMKLPPCHALFQFYTQEILLGDRVGLGVAAGVSGISGIAGYDEIHEHLDRANIPRRYIDCQLYQRSADVLLGVPFNIASYALLLEMIAQQVNMVPREFIWTGGDCHLYNNHFEQATLQLSRETRALPTMKITKAASIFDYTIEDFTLEGYDPHPAIKADVSV